MFRKLRIHGGTTGRIVWGYHTAAALRTWAITRSGEPGAAPTWTLTGQLTAVDSFQLRQRPLIFTAPRRGGFWCWPLLEAPIIVNLSMRVRLGPPEQ